MEELSAPEIASPHGMSDNYFVPEEEGDARYYQTGEWAALLIMEKLSLDPSIVSFSLLSEYG